MYPKITHLTFQEADSYIPVFLATLPDALIKKTCIEFFNTIRFQLKKFQLEVLMGNQENNLFDRERVKEEFSRKTLFT